MTDTVTTDYADPHIELRRIHAVKISESRTSAAS